MSFWKKIRDIGLKEEHGSKERKRIRILNILIYISIIHAVFFLILDGVTGNILSQKTLTLGIQFLLYFVILFLHYKYHIQAARILYVILILAVLFYHSNYAFKGYYGEYQYLIIPLGSLFFFDKKYIHYLALIIAIVAFYVPNLYYQNYPEQYFGYLNASFLFVSVFLVVFSFKRENDKNEYLLEKQRDDVLHDKRLLEKQKQDLKELNQFKTHLFTNISHEIRTPITLIKGYADRIFLEEDSEDVQNLNIIKKQAKEVQNIVDNLLDLSKLDAHKLKLNSTQEDVLAILNKLYVDYKKPFEDKEIAFSLDTSILDLSIVLDKQYFLRSLQNLLSNALKFTPKGGEVLLQVVYESDLHIKVIDNGIGIPEEDQDKIFTRFYQSKNHITESMGSGIGLSFAKNIIEAHGFQLNLKSIPNKKTEFTITIPEQYIQTEVISSDRKETEKHKKETKHTVLVVEDTVEMRNYLKLVLKEFQIVEAGNGKEALEILAHQEVDAIITDYMMPVMNGIEFVKILKEKSIRIPVIVLTARGDDTGKLKMLRTGIDGYYTKPFIEEELLLKLHQSILFYNNLKSFEEELQTSEKLELSQDETHFHQKLIDCIEENIHSKNFGVEQLADLLQLSRSTLFRKTRFVLGQTPNEVIKEIRFQKAKQLLKENPRMKKKELADAVGIYNATYFYDSLMSRFQQK